MDSAQTLANATISQTLAQWKQDSDLAGIRDDKELAKLPETERKEWQRLWAEVQALLDRAAGEESPDARQAASQSPRQEANLRSWFSFVGRLCLGQQRIDFAPKHLPV